MLPTPANALRLMPPEWGIRDSRRIGDITREQATGQLRGFFTAGYLTLPEYTARMEWVCAAQTSADIALVFTDLPPRLPEPPARKTYPLQLVSLLAATIGCTVSAMILAWMLPGHLLMLLMPLLVSVFGTGTGIRTARERIRNNAS